MRFQSYFNTALQLINAYSGEMPLAHYLKNYFAQHRKHGSKDRKYIAHICYCYYRLGHALKDISIEERLKAAIFLCNDTIAEWAVLFTEDWLIAHSAELDKRIDFLQKMLGFAVTQIFPWHALLSEGIDALDFAKSHLTQPNLFLRIRPGKKAAVVSKLNSNSIQFEEISDTCFALSNNSQADKILALNSEAVVQDYSSQQIATFLRAIQLQTANPHSAQAGHEPQTNIWDCCAASGGKSILAYDALENINLTVSDIRPSIINNLKQRFAEAGIKNYTSFVADIANPPLTNHHSRFTTHDSRFDIIICDAPCTGSGTWGRTPEQLYFFTPDKISHYAALQQKIAGNVLAALKAGGYFLYVTCSAFAAENEMCVEYILRQGLKPVEKSVIPGYGKKADTMFAALFKK